MNLEGVVVVRREDSGWQVEGIVKFGPNVARLLLTSRSQTWYVVGAYVTPNDAPAVHYVQQALAVAPNGIELILIGDLHTVMGASRCKGGKYCDGAGGLRAGRHDSPLHVKEAVHRVRKLDMEDEERGQTGDEEGELNP